MMIDRDVDQRFIRRVGRLRRHWRWILAGASGCAAAALVVSLFSAKIYRATTYVLVSDSKIGTASKDTAVQQIVMLPTFIPFVDNDALVSETLSKFHLDRPPYSLTPDLFRRRNYLDVRIPKSTRLLELNVDFPDAHLAAELVNDFARRAVEFNDRMNATDTSATQEFLKRQLDTAVDAMAQAAARRVKVQEEAQIEDREKELRILLSQKDELSARLDQLRLDLAQDESRSSSLTQALAGEPRTIQLKKSVTADRFLEAATEKLDPEGTPLSVTEEALNQTRTEMQRDFINATVSMAAENAGIQAATARLEQVNKNISELLARLTMLRSETELVDQDYTLAYEAVKSASREYQTSSVMVSSKSQDMKQVAPALVPERPVRPKILLNTVVGFLLGGFIFAGLAVGLENYRESRATSVLIDDEVRRVAVGRD
jgi:succinoglycan biosynthesis transport protein ExoP